MYGFVLCFEMKLFELKRNIILCDMLHTEVSVKYVL